MTSLVIEGGLLVALPELFSPIAVAKMSPEQVSAIASESAHVVATRKQLEKTIQDLEAGLQLFKSYRSRTAPGKQPTLIMQSDSIY